MTAAAAVIRPTRPRPRIRSFVIAIGLVAFTIYAARQVGFTVTTIVNLGNLPNNPLEGTLFDKGEIW